MPNHRHIPVLLSAFKKYIHGKLGSASKVIDATFGGGGYTEALLETGAFVVAVDRDVEAFNRAMELSSRFPKQLLPINCKFGQLSRFVPKDLYDLIIFDYGVSSYQLDAGNRGFSFRHDGPLDMRMSVSSDGMDSFVDDGLTAYHVVNQYSQVQLESILQKYGEEPFAPLIAEEIVRRRKERPITKTSELKDLIIDVVPQKFTDHKRSHPATRSFQAIRIEVNNELREVEHGLRESKKLLMQPGGILATVTFHALEDRIVKKELGDKKIWQSNGHPIMPSDDEITDNPRSRTGKLRIAKFLGYAEDYADGLPWDVRKIKFDS